MNTSRFLVVDDSESMRNVVSELLKEIGVRYIDQASNGHEAFRLFQEDPYDVVITDWNMPNGDGIELLNSIRNNEIGNDAPVLVMSGHVTTARIIEAIESGASGFVAKPFVGASLTRKVLRILGTMPTAYASGAVEAHP